MADKFISKIKLADGTTADLKDAKAREDLLTAQGAIAQEALDRAAADTTLQENITAEETRAKGIEGGLDERITNLEARGRFLSSWNATTGKPATNPSALPYLLKAGDYYIVDTVPSSGKKYQPEAKTVTGKEGLYYTGDASVTEETREIGVGDYYTFDGTKWIWVANSQKTTYFANIAGEPTDNQKLANALAGKLDDDSTTVAGVNFTNQAIAKDDLQTALELDALAYAATATGSTTLDTVDSIEMNKSTVAGNATVTYTATTYTIPDTQKAAYTPAGTITGSAIDGGSINVTIKDAETATAVTDLTYENYTPAGSVSLTASEEGSFQVAGINAASAVTVNTNNDTFVKSLRAGDVAAASFTEGAFTPAQIKSGFYTAGSAATWTGATYTAPSLGDASKSKFAAKMPKAVVGTGADAETLMFDYVDSTDTTLSANFADAVTTQGTLNSGNLSFGTFDGGSATVIDTTKFDGGSKAADTFSAQKLPVVDGTASALTEVTSAQAAAQTFTGSKFAPVFAGTAAAVKLTGAKYLKQEIDEKTFTGTTATLGFSGTERANLIPTAITYDKADAAAAFSVDVTPTTKTITKTAKTITVTVNPDAE